MNKVHSAEINGRHRELTCQGDGCIICRARALTDELCDYGADLHQLIISLAMAEHEASHDA